jgi:hypothetical protein
MRSRDWFLVSVRALGLWVFYSGVLDLMYCGSVLLGLGPSQLVEKDYLGSTEKAFTTYLWFAAVRLALAGYFLFGAEGLTKWVFKEYPRESTSHEGDDTGDDS